MEKGKKNDGLGGTGKMKLRYDLIPIYPLMEVARVYTQGAKKYGDNNWRNGIEWMRIVGAILRHLFAWIGGKKRHEGSMHSLASVVWGCFALMEYEHSHPELDDRPIESKD